MAYETKVILIILTMIADAIARADTTKEAYNFVVRAANAEGLKLPSFEEIKSEIASEKD